MTSHKAVVCASIQRPVAKPLPEPRRQLFQHVQLSNEFHGSSEARSKRPIKVLLVGETGHGKSTLVQYIGNYFTGATFGQPEIAIPTAYYPNVTIERFKAMNGGVGGGRAGLSQTLDCEPYWFDGQLESGANIRYYFIDTPSLSDTRGTVRDDENLRMIHEIAGRMGSLSALILVINGTACRASASLNNTLARIRASVPDALLKNVLVVLTHCKKQNANFSLESLGHLQPSHENVFYMNNAAFCTDPTTWTEEERADLEKEWNRSLDTVQAIVTRVVTLDEVSTAAFRAMREKRDRVKAELHELVAAERTLQTLQEQLADGAVEDDAAKYVRFLEQKRIECVEFVDDAVVNTLCTVHPESICHGNCGLEFTAEVGKEIFQQCRCMGNVLTRFLWGSAKCERCGCAPTNHFHARRKPTKVTKTVKVLLDDVSSAVHARQPTNSCSDDMRRVRAVSAQKREHIRALCVDLKAICSGFNVVDELMCVVEALKQPVATKHSGDREKLIAELIAWVDGIEANERAVSEKKGSSS